MRYDIALGSVRNIMVYIKSLLHGGYFYYNIMHINTKYFIIKLTLEAINNRQSVRVDGLIEVVSYSGKIHHFINFMNVTP